MQQTEIALNQSTRSNTLATGLAMFSMFFGAGNVVFPLALGLYAKSDNLYAILGLLISAVGVPFMGLISMILFNGNYKSFFSRLGAFPGFLLASAIMGLIGPFGAIPRCITLSFSTMRIYLPELDLIWFSIAASVLVFFCTFRKNSIIDVVGYFLTPILLISLGVIIVKGWMTSPAAPESTIHSFTIFFRGLVEGYQTMDLLGAFFFSSVVLECLECQGAPTDKGHYKQMIRLALRASSIGAGLLAIIYFGFSYIAAFNSEQLAFTSTDELAGRIANLVLGHYGGIVACSAVSLACLTTVIALSAVFAEFLQKDILDNRIRYELALFLTLMISFFVSTFNFTGIANFLTPILQICYPSLILLSLLNILYQLYDFRPVKFPVFLIFMASLVGYFLF